MVTLFTCLLATVKIMLGLVASRSAYLVVKPQFGAQARVLVAIRQFQV
jgi:hypothetical protein